MTEQFIPEDCPYWRICEIFHPEHCEGELIEMCGLYQRREEVRLEVIRQNQKALESVGADAGVWRR